MTKELGDVLCVADLFTIELRKPDEFAEAVAAIGDSAVPLVSF